MKSPIRTLAWISGALIGAACAPDEGSGRDDADPDGVERNLDEEELRAVTDEIKSVASARGIGNPLLYAGVPNHETGLVQCWADATHHCQGPYSDDCGGPVLAGSGDGPCADREGGLGMYQFDAGTHGATVDHYGAGVLDARGNIDQGLSTIIAKVRDCPNTGPFDGDDEAVVSWIATARPGTEAFEVFLSAMAWCYNGCSPTSPYCDHEKMRQNYRAGAEHLLETFGDEYWYGGGGGGTEAPKRAADVYAINRHGGTDTTEVHVLSAASRFESFRLQTATALGPTDAAMHELGVGDFDGDGQGDIYMIGRNGESGTTEVHVLDARDDFASFLLQTATALHPTEDPLYDFGVGDFDGDGRDDVYAIIREGQSGTTEVHVLDAARDFGDYLVHAATALHPTAEGPYDFGVGDFDGDGRDDVYLIIRNGQSGTTEVHVLDASRNFEAFLTHAVSGLHPTDSSAYDFAVGDFDIDGKDDVYAIARTGSSERTEVHVLSASSDFAEFLVHAASALHPTVDSNFTFAVGAL